MTRRLSALLSIALLAAALSAAGPATADPAAVPALRGTAPGATANPPSVGSCHAISFRELAKAADPDPAVSCDDPHTTLTVKVVTFSTAPDWDDPAKVAKRILTPCLRALVARSGGSSKTFQMSAYSLAFFFPTRAQRANGAKWIRCDLYLAGGRTLLTLPANDAVSLGPLPLGDRFAKCRLGERGGYALTSCSRSHAFRAKIAIRYPHRSYPGVRAAKRFALRKCRSRMDTRFFYESVAPKQAWKAGLRHAICLRPTSG